MGKNMDAADVWQLREPVDELGQGIARDGRAFLCRAVVEETACSWPRVEHGNAAEARIRHNLRKPEPRLVVACVEPMGIEQDIAV